VTQSHSTETDNIELTVTKDSCTLCKYGNDPIDCRRCKNCLFVAGHPGFKAAARSHPIDKSDTVDNYEGKKDDPAELTLWLDTLRITSLQVLAKHIGLKKTIGKGKYDLINDILERSL